MYGHIIPFLQPLLYNYVGTSTRDEDRDKDHKLDHDIWSFFLIFW